MNDGSRDGTFDALVELCVRDSRTRALCLRMNPRGQAAELSVGFDHSSADVIISMDGDLQHVPEEITGGGLEPNRVEQGLLWGGEDPDVFVDIGSYLDVKVDSLGAHASQMSSDREVRLQRVTNNSGRHKEATGLDHAEGFRRITFNLGSLEWQLLHQ